MADVTLESTEEIIQLVSVSGASQGDITSAVNAEAAARSAADTTHATNPTAHGLTANISAALTAAASPSAGNPFATKSQQIADTATALQVTQPAEATSQIMLRGVTADTNAGDFTFVLDGTPYFNTTRDNTLFWGYNVKAQGARENTAEPTFHLAVESNYEVTPGVHWMEHYMQYVSSDGNTSYRPFAFVINRATHVGTGGYLLSQLYITKPDGSTPFVGIGTQSPNYPLHIAYDFDGAAMSPVMTNGNTGTSALVGAQWGENVTTKAIQLLVFGTNYSSAPDRLTATFYAQSGLTGGIRFQTTTTAPVVFYTNNLARLTIAGDGTMTGTVSLSVPTISGTNLSATGQFLAADGTKSAPGWAFTTASTTGFYRRSGVTEFSVGGSPLIQINSNSFVWGGSQGFALAGGATDAVGPDVGIRRTAGGQLTISNGSTGYGDLLFGASSVGPILTDTTNGHTYRLQSTNGTLVLTQVT